MYISSLSIRIKKQQKNNRKTFECENKKGSESNSVWTKIFIKKIKIFIFKNLFFFSSLRLRSVDQVYRVIYGAADADHPQLTTTNLYYTNHSNPHEQRTRTIGKGHCYLFIHSGPAGNVRIRQRNDYFFKYRPSVCHWANRKYQKLDWVCLYHRSLWQCCCCCCYRWPSGELCPTVVEAEAELVAVDCEDWRTAPVETKQTRNETKNIFTFVETIVASSSLFLLVSIHLKKDKRRKRENSFLFPVLN